MHIRSFVCLEGGSEELIKCPVLFDCCVDLLLACIGAIFFGKGSWQVMELNSQVASLADEQPSLWGYVWLARGWLGKGKVLAELMAQPFSNAGCVSMRVEVPRKVWPGCN